MAADQDITDEMSNRRISESSEFWEELDRNQQLEFSPDRCPPTDPLNGSDSAADIASPEGFLLEHQFESQQLSEQELDDWISALAANTATHPSESSNLLLNTSDQYNEQGDVVGGHFNVELPRTTEGTGQQAPVPLPSPAQPRQTSGPAASAASVRVQNQAHPRPTGVAQVVRDNSTCTRSEPSATSDVSKYDLPLHDDFRLTVMFRKKQVIEREKERDCTLYYQSPDHDSDPVTPATTTKVPIMTSHTDFLNSKEKRLTLKILENCIGGVRIYSDTSGNIFVRRLCNTRVYWSDVETTKKESLKLEHDKVRKVFDFFEFYAHLKSRCSEGRQHETVSPSIWLSFAQKHDAACPVNTCLVWVRIDPLRAREMVDGVNPEVEPTSVGESLDSANIQSGMSMFSSHLQMLEFSLDRCLPTDPLNGSESTAGIARTERSLLEQLQSHSDMSELSEQELADLISALAATTAAHPSESNNLLLNTSDQYNEQGDVVGGHFNVELPRTTGGTDQQAPVLPLPSPAQPRQTSGPAASAASVRVQNQAPSTPTEVAQVVRDNSTRSELSFDLSLRDDFRLKVMFRKKQVIEREKERDCTLYYKSLDHDSDPVTPATTTKVPIMTSHTDFLNNEGNKEKRLTLKILENCLEGVRIYSDTSGNIFVRRLCKTHVYWSDVETTKKESSKLEHDKVKKVFDFVEFSAHVQSRYRESRQHETVLPSIWLSFAQKHGAACPVNTCLVWVRIDPLRAREMVDGVNPDVEPTSFGESLNSANIQDGMSM
ncbi:uncharacterized protein [Diadema setosum]|uniref:uncharacterized protein n=1 Tax=Diadema setosum TaxID=31175 RepID=UPI003B3A178C